MAVNAALQTPGRQIRRRNVLRCYRLVMAAILATVFCIALALDVVHVTPANAATFNYNARPAPAPRVKPPANKEKQMLVQAVEINYDYNNSRVSAVGNVQIYYNGSTLEADKVIYDQKTKRLHGEGNVRLTDSDGKVTYAEILDFSDDYRDGFVDSLRLDLPNKTRLAAPRAERTNGDVTIFQNGVYTACAACKDDPKKPPLWQVKGARIIHNQTEKMLYFEDAQLEFFGVPLAYLPYFSTPDPTVKRKTGFLIPYVNSTSRTGIGVETPFYWSLAPDYDLTLTPRIMSTQGVLMQGDFRQRLINGAYEIRAYGIRQEDPGKFGTEVGNRDARAGFDSTGQFALNDKWVVGYDAIYATDNTFFRDYSLAAYRNPLNAFLLTPDEGISQAYLTGVGNRSYFDARTIYYFGFSPADIQGQIPVVHPVIDYTNVLNRNILGGEFSYKGNFTSLSRDKAAFDPINTKLGSDGLNLCLPTSADPGARTPANCLLRGVPGDYNRLSGQVDWRRSFTDSAGQIFTPFASVRADLINTNILAQPGVSNYNLSTGDNSYARLMPTIGLEYRYPFINVQPWGTTTVEPIAQVIVRPNEQHAANLPNEDAQSLTFDDTNLFRVDKFSGWDREEGGGRANVGVQATTQFDRGGSINVLFGQSYQLFGQNSFAVADLTNTGINTGLETARSDYVGRIAYQPNKVFSLTTRVRLDEATLDVRRFETEARANFDRFSVSALYGNYDKQPELGFLTRREGVLMTGSFKVSTNWVVSGGVRYDLDKNQVNQYIVGAGYVDDCFLLALNYISDYSYTTNVPTINNRVMLQIGLRTLGGTGIASNIGSPP